MKKISLLSILFVMSFALISCDLVNEQLGINDQLGSNELDGDTDIPLNKQGNEYGAYFTLNDVKMDIESDIKIVENNNGIITIHIKMKLSELGIFSEYIPEKMLDDNGDIDTEVKFKSTSNGIQDFYHSDNNTAKPFTIVKYKDGVGTKYEFTRLDGKKVTREIISKSSEDDYPMGFMLIKTTAIEEKVDNEKLEKVVCLANHKFGLVNIKFYGTIGWVLEISLVPWGVIE